MRKLLVSILFTVAALPLAAQPLENVRQFQKLAQVYRYLSGLYVDDVDMEPLVESAIEGMETGLFCCLAHPDLLMRSYPAWDRHCTLTARHICSTAARLDIPL